MTMGTWPRITELLIYAAVKNGGSSLPTPPTSSSPTPLAEACQNPPAQPLTLKVYALPLSSTIIDQAANSAAVVPTPEDDSASAPAYFLPRCTNEHREAQKIRQKRQDLSSLFDDATQKRRKLKGRGGESVAQAMAGFDRPAQKGFSIESSSEPLETLPRPISDNLSRKTLSRSSSMTSIATTDYTKPGSRSGPLANGKRSSLHRVENAISPRDSPAFSETDDTYSIRNKAALTKVVMAGMRLYGLHQRKKSEVALDNNTSQEFEVKDEYKLVYHQTFKAATFTFRNQLSAQLIPQDTMRDMVDRLLCLFCTDPMAPNILDNGDLPAFGSQASNHAGGFDLPSGKNSSPSAMICSTPTTKKR